VIQLGAVQKYFSWQNTGITLKIISYQSKMTEYCKKNRAFKNHANKRVRPLESTIMKVVAAGF